MSRFNFKSDVRKKMKFMLETHEVDPRDLEYRFKISVENVEYGFKGSVTKSGKVLFEIPPLNKVINENIRTGQYRASIDVMKEGFYSKAWNGSVTIEGAPKVRLESSKGVMIKDEPLVPNKKIRAVGVRESEEAEPNGMDILIGKQQAKDALKDKNDKLGGTQSGDDNDDLPCECDTEGDLGVAKVKNDDYTPEDHKDEPMEENSVSGMPVYEVPAGKAILKQTQLEDLGKKVKKETLKENKVNLPKWFKK